MVKQELNKKLEHFIETTGEDWNYILPTELEKALREKKDYFLLDVRREQDFKERHIHGSTNIFWLDILKPENLKKLPKNKKIIIVCYVGHTASQVLVLLRLLDYDASVLKFGMGHSPHKGLPISGWMNYSFDTE